MLILRHFPMCVTPFLRWQLGTMIARPMVEVLYDAPPPSLKISGYKTLNRNTEVFRVVSYGRTREEASARFELSVRLPAHVTHGEVAVRDEERGIVFQPFNPAPPKKQPAK